MARRTSARAFRVDSCRPDEHQGFRWLLDFTVPSSEPSCTSNSPIKVGVVALALALDVGLHLGQRGAAHEARYSWK